MVKKRSPRHVDGEPITVGGVVVAPGERQRIEIPVASSYGRQSVLPVIVVNGRHAGPRLFVSAAIHGDEINGVEIVRRLLLTRALKRLHGTLIATPVVNVYGFMAQSRYLPDRRDLNRAFPGSPTGSLAARLAHVFMTEVVQHSTHGIDLHTGSNHRINLPQIRACLDQKETARLAMAFGVPVVLDSNLRDGSLRQAVTERDIPMLLYEAGEALRFDELAIRAGVRGVVSVMRAISMLRTRPRRPTEVKPLVAKRSLWVRASASGTLRNHAALGERVDKGATLGWVADPYGGEGEEVAAPAAGVVIGRNNLPLVNEGDALYHLALFGRPRKAVAGIETFHAELNPDQEPSPSGEPPIL
jgi:predicted deacylase